MLGRFLSIIISKIKGEQFVLDKNIPSGYLLVFVLNKLIEFIRGMLIFRKLSCSVFISTKCSFKCKSKIKLCGTVVFGRGVYIDALSEKGITLENNVSVGKYTTIECSGSLKDIGKGLSVGENVGMGTHGFWGCAGGISVGDDTIFGNYVSLHSENHNFKDLARPIRQQGINRQGIKIGSDCWIGAKVTILDGANIGNGCIIAAGSVVKSGFYEDNSIYGGVPAKLLKKR
ncbi:acyltransferase [Carboxylicivirga caseinilyticus]|uniref:acyltransferase n=1 Tax=Carboxylicivirga caseinilyticus TaxID=3417572 RepID=UPI003D33C377|nr:acyltransferase [Marinilabiliaceae bacterium A049]